MVNIEAVLALALVQFVALVGASVLIVWTIRRYGGPITTALLIAAVGTAVWNGAAVGRVAVDAADWSRLFVGVADAGRIIAGVGFATFAYRFYTRKGAAWWSATALVAVVPVVEAGVGVVPEPLGYTAANSTAIGPIFTRGFVAGGIYAVGVGLFMFSAVVMFRLTADREHRVDTLRGTVLALAATLTVLADLGGVVGLFPTPGFEYGGVVAVGTVGAGAALVQRDGVLMTAPFSREDILESVGEGVIIVDANQEITDYNHAAVEALPEIRGMYMTPIGDILPSGTEAVVDEQRYADSVEAAVNNDDRTFVVEEVTVRGGDDVRMGHVLTIRDVTEVEEYAADLERQTEQLDQFASVVAHDLRNPLSVIGMQLDNLIRTSNDDLADDLGRVRESADRMDEIITDALTLAREGSAIDEEDIRPVRLDKTAEDAWHNIDRHEASLNTALGDGGGPINGDPSRLQTMFENLFRNAIEHGGDDVCIVVRRTADGFEVADDGDGIPAGHVDDIFDEGVTFSDGTGFGLSIVQSIVKAHGWLIEAYNDSGAVFAVSGMDYRSD